ncbi:MAG: capsule assembly Wzi family protein, partial [Calditrichaeota bacterium]|nr:capsule assembly Wzi family protein [Calditrichota bacterium]
YHETREDSLQAKKYFAGHRLEINPVFWLSLGLSETVIFKGRSFEPAYLNPVMFLRSAEHYLGSPDNMMMSADFRLLPFNNVAIYGELLLDDITTTKLGTDWYGNKFGYLTGVFWAKVPLVPDFDFRAEYVRLRPFVYSHENSVNYSHYASTLGHWTGPNSDLLWLRANFYPHFRFRISAEFQFRRYGENSEGENVGGDIEKFWTEEAGSETKFLAGRRVDQLDASWGIEYEFLPQIYFRAGIIFLRTTEKTRSGQAQSTSSLSLWTSLGMNF